ncbi:MAG: hypothetical protein RIE77_02580 [Phycisphaerales bacterium]|jgi:hypothetical protein
MNTIDLIELAVLDALGMLDDAESKAFDAAFKAAPPATQERVLSEQARLANLQGLLPDVEPAADMRDRVVTAVREAMLADAIAKASEAEDVDGPLSIRRSRGVSRVWRISAIASAAAAVAFGVAFGHSTLRYEDLNKRIVNNLVLQGDIRAYEADVLEFIFNRESVQEVAFTPVDPTSEVRVLIEYLEEGNVGALRCANLPRNRGTEYALVELDGRNQIGRSLRQFESDGILTGQYLQDLVLENGMRLALVSVDVASGTKQIMATTTINL